MTDLARDDLSLDELATPKAGRARTALIKRLTDVVCLPSSRVNAHERAMTADLLVEMLREAQPAERARVARRLCALSDIPNVLARLLLRDGIEIARPLIEEATLSDADLLGCVREGGPDHRKLVARRREVSEVVSEVLVDLGPLTVVEQLLKNAGARLSQTALEAAVAASRTHAPLVPLLLKRPELRPSQAYVMFWWAEPEERRQVLTRFAVSREVLQDAAGDVFPMAAKEGWSDPLVRKALQFIERRQRNRSAVAKSPFASLDEAVAAAESGMTRQVAQEIAYLAGLKPTTAAKIFTDPYGEPLAVMAKAAGLPRESLVRLWRALRRPETDSSGAMAPGLQSAVITFDSMAVDRAQTVLRYWNWALSSALTPTLIRALRAGDDAEFDEFSVPQRAAMLALGRDFRR